MNDGHGHFTDATAAWGLGKTTRWSLSSIFADYDGDGRPDLLVTNDFGLKNLYRNDGGRRFVDETARAGAQVRAYGMSGTIADFNGDGLLDLYTTGTDTQWYFLHDYPSLPIGFPGRVFLPIAIRWMETMATGNSLLLQKPDHTFADATPRSGAAHAGWNWSSVAADLDNDSWPDIYATNGMWGDGRDHDRELEFWWQSLAYWDDYVAGTEDLRPQGRRHRRHRTRPLFPKPLRRPRPLPHRRPLRGTFLPGRPRPRNQRPRRRRLRRQQRRRPRPLHPLRPGPRSPLPRHPPPQRTLSPHQTPRHPRPGQPTTASAAASRPSCPAAAA